MIGRRRLARHQSTPARVDSLALSRKGVIGHRIVQLVGPDNIKERMKLYEYHSDAVRVTYVNSIR